MNIHHLPATELVPFTTEGLIQLFVRRINTFKGFAEVEKDNGSLLTWPMSLRQPNGQDAARLLWARCLEELAEADEARDSAHVKEEVIDAVNYGLSIAILDPTILTPESMASAFYYAYTRENSDKWPILHQCLPYLVTQSSFLADLRNRSWQKSIQNFWFDGDKSLLAFVSALGTVCAHVFDSPQDFVWFYISKDQVLQFRLSSNY